jgi:hypothetical protein
LCRLKYNVGISYQPISNPLCKEPGKPFVTWSICCTCDFHLIVAIGCIKFLVVVMVVVSDVAEEEDDDDDSDGSDDS